MGLLLLRVLVAAMSLVQLANFVRPTQLSLLNGLLALIVVVSSTLLLIGFLTPIVAVFMIGLTLFSLVFEVHSLIQSVEIVALAAAIALIGPGAFSIDARMFGRREILIPTASRSSKS